MVRVINAVVKTRKEGRRTGQRGLWRAAGDLEKDRQKSRMWILLDLQEDRQTSTGLIGNHRRRSKRERD
jgi:hypothetical protein